MKIKIVTATKNSVVNEKQTNIYRSWEQLSKVLPKKNETHLDLTIYTDNAKGLSEVYNEAIEKFKDEFDILIFAHDDLLISDLFFFDKLESAFTINKYDVLGIAGTNNLSLSKPAIPEAPTGWHNSDRKGWSGFVEHPTKNDNTDFNTNNFGPTPREVVTIDGLFIGIRTSAITNKIRFDEQFKWDFYDLDFCLNCHKEKLKIGVQGIYCRHNSHGEGYLESKYRKTEKDFLKKWKKK
jgi:hypothetical protein